MRTNDEVVYLPDGRVFEVLAVRTLGGVTMIRVKNGLYKWLNESDWFCTDNFKVKK